MKKMILSHVSKSFGERSVFRDFTTEIGEERPTLLLGNSGSGKTTLLRILAGLETASHGELRLFENNEEISVESLRISYVFQEDRFIEELSAYRNLLFVLGKQAHSAAKKEEIKRMARIFDLEEQLFEPVTTYSGGMKRRLSLLRALLKEADLYLLDEAFKGLDEERKKKALALVRETLRGKLVVIVTHDKEVERAFQDARKEELSSF